MSGNRNEETRPRRERYTERDVKERHSFERSENLLKVTNVAQKEAAILFIYLFIYLLILFCMRANRLDDKSYGIEESLPVCDYRIALDRIVPEVRFGERRRNESN